MDNIPARLRYLYVPFDPIDSDYVRLSSIFSLPYMQKRKLSTGYYRSKPANNGTAIFQ